MRPADVGHLYNDGRHYDRLWTFEGDLPFWIDQAEKPLSYSIVPAEVPTVPRLACWGEMGSMHHGERAYAPTVDRYEMALARAPSMGGSAR